MNGHSIVRRLWARVVDWLTFGGAARPREASPSGKIILLPEADLNYRAARRYRPPSSVVSVHGHGTPRTVAGLDSRRLAELIRASGQWRPPMRIKLDACWSGSGDANIAAELADILDTEVVAPTTRTLTCGPWDMGAWHSVRIPRTERALPYWPGRWKLYRPRRARDENIA